MNFKIEYNFLDITNSPSIERYFEERASEGWLINKIYLGSVFIFKKIEPQAFDFSISPYEIETFYSRKSNSEMQEFREVSEAIGWNYVMESYDSHIYYKEVGSEAIPIQTDEEEAFITLEAIAKKRIRDNWIQIFWLVFLSWFNISGMMSSVDFLTEGAGQILLAIIAIGLTIAIWYILHMKKFIKINRQNVEVGEPIEYSDSKFIIPKLTFFAGGFFILLFFIYFLYLGFVLKNQSSKVFFLIFFVGVAIWVAYSVFVKPAQASLQSKRKSWIMAIFLAFLIGAGIGVSDIDDSVGALNESIKIDEFKVLRATDFPGDQVVEEYPLYRDISLVVPESYEYFYVNEKDEFVQTEYGRALNESLAKNLTQRYLKERKKIIVTGIQKNLSYILVVGFLITIF